MKPTKKAKAGCHCGGHCHGTPYLAPIRKQKPATGRPRKPQGHANPAQVRLDTAIDYIDTMMVSLSAANTALESAEGSLELGGYPGTLHMASTTLSLAATLDKISMTLQGMGNDLAHVRSLVARYRERRGL